MATRFYMYIGHTGIGEILENSVLWLTSCRNRKLDRKILYEEDFRIEDAVSREIGFL